MDCMQIQRKHVEDFLDVHLVKQLAMKIVVKDCYSMEKSVIMLIV